MTQAETTNRIILLVEIEGTLTEAVVDTGTPYVICAPRVAFLAGFNCTYALERMRMLIRGMQLEVCATSYYVIVVYRGTMNSLAQIEAAITQLSEAESRELLAWLQSYVDDTWDREIESDAKTGRLDKLIQEAEADIATNRIKPLDEVLHNF